MNSRQSTVFNQQFSVNGYQLSVFFIRQLILTACLLLTVSCLLLTVSATTLPLSREDRLKVFDDVWQTIENRYYDVNLHGVNWTAQRDKFRVAAANAPNETEFYRILKLMVGALRDSHTRVYAANEKSDWRSPRVISVGASVREIENQLIFTNVDKNSTAYRSGIRIGDCLKSVDNVLATNLLERRLSEQTGASTAAIARLRAVAGIFEGAIGSTVQVGFQSGNNKKARFAILEREWRTLPASVKSQRVDSVLIVTFDAFAPDIVRDFFQILHNETDGVMGIVLDLRANRGGSTEAMADIASAFLPENQLLGRFIDRAGQTEVETVTRSWLLYTASSVKVPQIPIVILTATATASAAEIFAAALKNAGRAQLVGTTTCGCVLAIKNQHTLPDGGLLEISELDFKMPDGTRLEGVGVAPDEKITTTRRDLRAHRDPTLERALKLIKS